MIKTKRFWQLEGEHGLENDQKYGELKDKKIIKIEFVKYEQIEAVVLYETKEEHQK